MTTSKARKARTLQNIAGILTSPNRLIALIGKDLTSDPDGTALRDTRALEGGFDKMATKADRVATRLGHLSRTAAVIGDGLRAISSDLAVQHYDILDTRDGLGYDEEYKASKAKTQAMQAEAQDPPTVFLSASPEERLEGLELLAEIGRRAQEKDAARAALAGTPVNRAARRSAANGKVSK